MSIVPLSFDPVAGREPVRACPLCRGRDSTLVRTLTEPSGRIAGTFEMRRCAHCGLAHTHPLPNERDLELLYDERFYFSTGWWYQAAAAIVIEIIQGARRRRVEGLARVGRVLDIGSGDGSFVHHMAEHGWDATGIDISSAACEFARRRSSGGRFLLGPLEAHAFEPGRFDVITMWQVLEHVASPPDLLARCRDLLAPGGVLVAAVPNVDGWSSRLTGARWWGLDVPRHLVHYTPETLARAVERAGLHVVRMRHRSLQYDPYGLMHSSLDWLFTRRHFFSDLAKRQVEAMPPAEWAWNAGVLVVATPVLAPLSLLVTSVAAACGGGGFIEVSARRP